MRFYNNYTSQVNFFLYSDIYLDIVTHLLLLNCKMRFLTILSFKQLIHTQFYMFYSQLYLVPNLKLKNKNNRKFNIMKF